MYKIIGGDQKEYGPVTADQIGQWIREGRANGQTLVQAEGGPWKPLSTFSEFASALGTGSSAPPPPLGATPSSPAFGTEPARAAVQAPAICLIILGSLGALGNLIGVVAAPFGSSFPFQQSTGDPNIDRWIEMMSGGAGAALSALGLVLTIVVILGGARMLKLRNYGLCIAASILVMLPCSVGICCCLGLPAGIWSIVVLNRPEVKAAFQNLAGS